MNICEAEVKEKKKKRKGLAETESSEESGETKVEDDTPDHENALSYVNTIFDNVAFMEPGRSSAPSHKKGNQFSTPAEDDDS